MHVAGFTLPVPGEKIEAYRRQTDLRRAAQSLRSSLEGAQ